MAESPLGRLAGAWEFEASVAGRSMGTGHATFEWIEDGAFLLGRSVGEWTDPGWVENAPRTTRWVIGIDDTTLEVTQPHADDRGVTRIYRGTLTGDHWHMERAAPRFHQQFVGVTRTRRDDRRAMGDLAGRHHLAAGLPDRLPQERNHAMTAAGS